jgi:transposase InsO family protein
LENTVATGSNQVWSWDISYLLCTKKYVYFYLYFIVDIWDRSIVGWKVHESESGDNAANLIYDTTVSHNVGSGDLYLHSDNGAPMISVEYLSTTSLLGIDCSYSRPGMSDDNPYSESLFRTTKYRPGYPERFESIQHARSWISEFVDWYNTEHLHSGIKFVTPIQRRSGEDVELLKTRKATYEIAKKANPNRWSANIRNWDKPECVTLNPRGSKNKELRKCA